MEKEQFEYYFREYHSLIFRIAFTELKSHADAEDVVQEVFFRILRYHPEFESTEHEKAWMIRSTINRCKDFLKNKWNNSTVGLDRLPEGERAYLHLPYVQEDGTLWAVLELTERYRQPLYLFYYEDYSIKEIAQILGLPENTVKTNLRRGREAVRKLLESQENVNGNGDEQN